MISGERQQQQSTDRGSRARRRRTRASALDRRIARPAGRAEYRRDLVDRRLRIALSPERGAGGGEHRAARGLDVLRSERGGCLGAASVCRCSPGHAASMSTEAVGTPTNDCFLPAVCLPASTRADAVLTRWCGQRPMTCIASQNPRFRHPIATAPSTPARSPVATRSSSSPRVTAPPSRAWARAADRESPRETLNLGDWIEPVIDDPVEQFGRARGDHLDRRRTCSR